MSFSRRRTQPGTHALDPQRATPGNSLTLLKDGAAAFPVMLDAIDSAREAIILGSYIFAADRTGRRFRDALIAARRRGVAVRVLVDGVGSLSTPSEFWQPLRLAGGRVAIYHPPAPWRPKSEFWRRDHRKLLVVDEQIGFIGGLNIADDYAPVSDGGSGWHDMHARIVGPAACEFTRILNRTWLRITGEDFSKSLCQAVPSGDVAVEIIENRFRTRSAIHHSYLHAIKRASRCIRITNAYFIPDRALSRALIQAVQRGVKVQLLLAGPTDVKPVRYASRARYMRFMRQGVEIYEWTEAVLHAKTAVIDGAWCSIGSFNMDHRSLLHNLEANAVCVDLNVGQALDRTFEADLARAQRIDPNTWHRRPWLDKLFEQLFYKLRILL